MRADRDGRLNAEEPGRKTSTAAGLPIGPYEFLARAAVFLTAGLICLWQIYVWTRLGWWNHGDMDVYWLAGERVRSGSPLYQVFFNDPTSNSNYIYAPWFAWLFAVITLFPREVVDVTWFVALAVSSLVVLRSLLRSRSLAGTCLFLLVLPGCVMACAAGNVQLLIVVALMWGLERRSGPLWVAIAASLKFAPIAFVLIYVSRGEWQRAILSVLLATVFTAPILLYSVDTLRLSMIGGEMGLAVAAAVSIAAFFAARWRPGWAPIAALSLTLLSPHFHLFNLSWAAPSAAIARGVRRQAGFAPMRPSCGGSE